MKKYGYIVLMFLCALTLASCGDDDDTIDYEKLLELYGDWKAENDQAFQAIAANPDYTEIKSAGNDGSIYIKVLKEGAGREPIYYTDSVKVYYTGKTIDGEVFDSAEYPFKQPAVFGICGNSTQGGLITGWVTALQHMHVGDRWEAWIPQELAYKTGKYDSNTGKYSILPFSTLHFELEVVGIIRNGKLIEK